MAIAVQTIGTGSYGTSSAVVTKPTGLVVGDLMVVQLAAREGGTINILTGWADVGSGQISTSDSGVNLHQRLLYKIADASDVAASNFTFTISTAASYFRGVIYRIDGQNPNTSVDKYSMSGVLNNITPSFAVNLTPTYASELYLCFFITRTSGVSNTISGYTLATSNPTWTEGDDSSAGAGAMTMSSAYATRAETTATGNLSVTIDSGASDTDTVGALVIIKAIKDVTVTPSTLTLTGATQTPTIAGGAVVTPATVNLTTSVKDPTSATQADWSAVGKSPTTSFTNTPKS